VDEKGRNVTLWPDWTFAFRQQTLKFDSESYELQPASRTEREEVPA
jgi:hypothetical protein